MAYRIGISGAVRAFAGPKIRRRYLRTYPARRAAYSVYKTAKKGE